MVVAGRLVVWINAFIPRDVPGYTVPIMRGENAGKTAVPLPTLARIPVPITNNLIRRFSGIRSLRGNTVVNLLGSANRPVAGATMFGSSALAPATFRGQNIFNVFQ